MSFGPNLELLLGPGDHCSADDYTPIIHLERVASILVVPAPPALLQVNLAMARPPIEQCVCHVHDTVLIHASK